MGRALELAQIAASAKEVPVGAVLVRGTEVLAEAHNRTVVDADPTSHAELLTIRSASMVQGDWRLLDTTLYVTLEPCAMCAGAIIKSRLRNVFFGSYNNNDGCVSSIYNLCNDSRFNHKSGVQGGILNQECSYLLTSFFK